MKNEGAKWTNIIAIMSLLIVIIFNSYTLWQQNISLQVSEKIASADYILKLSQELDNIEYDNVANTINNKPHNSPVLSQTYPKISEADLDNYIGKLETVGDLVEQNVISQDMAYEEFSYLFVKAWCNSDVKTYIMKNRKIDNIYSGSTSYYHGLESFATYSMQKEHKNCNNYEYQ